NAPKLVATPPKSVATPPNSPPRPFLSPPGLYYVDSEGQRVAGSAFAVGSGSSYAYGVLDRGLAEPVASEEEALALARRAIFQAATRDAYSGDSVRVLQVGPQGWRQVSCDCVAQLHERYGK
uniref:Proteasome subunit beta type-5 n=2 Tax=Cyanistes caeruleus TaxID=156563 RepID=A0A8C0V8G4_CYACU